MPGHFAMRLATDHRGGRGTIAGGEGLGVRLFPGMDLFRRTSVSCSKGDSTLKFSTGLALLTVGLFGCGGCGARCLEDTMPTDSIHAACLRGNIAAVQRFIASAPETVNLPDSSGETPLQAAASARQTAIAEFLIRSGADTGAGDFLGYTPLQKCAEVDNREVAMLLLRNGVKADVVARQKASRRFGVTPLELAAMRGHVEFAKLLLDSGPRPSRRFWRTARPHYIGLVRVRPRTVIKGPDARSVYAR